MTRSRSRASAKAAGTRFERAMADYLAEHVDDRIDRRVKNGAKDRGDLGGIRLSPALGGGRVTVECKDVTRLDVAGWLREAEIERGNDDALVGAVVAKRRGKTDPAEQLVLMTMRDFVAILTGERRPADD